MSRSKTLLPAALAAIALAWLASLPAQAADPDVVKFGSVGGITDAGLYLADDLGFFKEAGVKVEMMTVSTAPALAAAVATSQLDVGGIAVTPALFASVEQGIELRMVGDKQSMRPGFSATRMIVRPAFSKATEDETMHGLKGKTIALSSRELITHYFLWRILTKHGMSLSDVKIAELSYPTMAAALASGAVDGAISIEPFLSKAILAGDAKEVSDLTEFGPSTGMCTVAIVYSEKFRKEREPAQHFMTAYMRGVRVYNDAFVKNKDRDKVIDIIARHARMDRDIIKNSFPIGLSPDQRIDTAALKAVEQFYLDQHLLAAPIDPAKIVDMSFADAAVKALGPYKYQ